MEVTEEIEQSCLIFTSVGSLSNQSFIYIFTCAMKMLHLYRRGIL